MKGTVRKYLHDIFLSNLIYYRHNRKEIRLVVGWPFPVCGPRHWPSIDGNFNRPGLYSKADIADIKEKWPGVSAIDVNGYHCYGSWTVFFCVWHFGAVLYSDINSIFRANVRFRWRIWTLINWKRPAFFVKNFKKHAMPKGANGNY